MGITPTTTTCMNPKEVSRAKTPAYIHCPSLCSRSSIPGRKGLYWKQIAETIMEEQLVMTLVSPKQLQTSLRKYLHYWGGQVGRPQLPGLPSGGKATDFPWSQLRREQTHRCRCLDLARLLRAPHACPSPWALAFSCPAACSTSTQTPSPQGLVLLA